MKTTFSRLFGTAAAIMLAALLLLGTFFQVLVKDYLVTNTTEKLTADAQTIAELAAAYNADSSLSNPNFLTNLIISSRISMFPVISLSVWTTTGVGLLATVGFSPV